jgi:hypothetical protein
LTSPKKLLLVGPYGRRIPGKRVVLSHMVQAVLATHIMMGRAKIIRESGRKLGGDRMAALDARHCVFVILS